MPAPSPWVVRHAALVPAGGAVLDVACGSGRHAHFFAGRGHPVTAIDRDTSRIEPVPGVEIVEADLEAGRWPLPGLTFAGIVVANYLHRPLFPVLIGALAADGVLIYETFAAGNERYGRPRNPDFLLRPNELLEAFAPSLTVVAYEAGLIERETPAVMQRIVAVRAAGDGPPRLPQAD